MFIFNMGKVYMRAQQEAARAPEYARQWLARRLVEQFQSGATDLWPAKPPPGATVQMHNSWLMMEQTRSWSLAQQEGLFDAEFLEKAQRAHTKAFRMALLAGEEVVLFAPSPFFMEAELTGLRDWLAALPEHDPRLAEKLSKLSLGQAQEHAARWHSEMARKQSLATGQASDVRLVLEVPEQGGQPLRWVELTSPEARDFEGAAMGHCVGQGNYDDVRILSLRDAENMPHVTIELGELDGQTSFEQVKGKGNAAPVARYVPAVLAITEHILPGHFNAADATAMGFIWRDSHLLPIRDALRTAGDLHVPGPIAIRGEADLHILEPNITSEQDLRIYSMPGLLEVHGDLFAYGNLSIVECPELVTISGEAHGYHGAVSLDQLPNLERVASSLFSSREVFVGNSPKLQGIELVACSLGKARLENLPSLSYLGGGWLCQNLALEKCGMATLGQGWEVSHDLKVSACPNLETLPHSVMPHGNSLVIQECEKLVTIEDGIAANTVHLAFCPKLRDLPENLLTEDFPHSAKMHPQAVALRRKARVQHPDYDTPSIDIWTPRTTRCCMAFACRMVASGRDVPLLTRLGHRLWAAGSALRGRCGVMRAQLGR